MYAGNCYQIGFLALVAAVSSSTGSAINYDKQHYHIELDSQKQCEFPDFPDYVQTFNVTFYDNSTLNFESDAPHIPNDKEMVEYCRSGWWVSYDDFNYKTWQGNRFGYLLNFHWELSEHPMSPSCEKPSEYFHARQIRSARRIGYDDSSPSATFFSEKYYGGEPTVYKNGSEIPVLPFEIHAFAVLNTGVLFFEEENFQGASIYNPNTGCRTIGCNGQVIYYLCHNELVHDDVNLLPFIPKSAKIVNQGP